MILINPSGTSYSCDLLCAAVCCDREILHRLGWYPTSATRFTRLCLGCRVLKIGEGVASLLMAKGSRLVVWCDKNIFIFSSSRGATCKGAWGSRVLSKKCVLVLLAFWFIQQQVVSQNLRLNLMTHLLRISWVLECLMRGCRRSLSVFAFWFICRCFLFFF